MKIRLENKDSFEMFGIEAIIHLADGANFKEVPEFWDRCFGDGSVDQLALASGLKHPITTGPFAVHAVMEYALTPDNTFPYLIGAFVNPEANTAGYKIVTIGTYLWAIFTTDPYTQENLSEVVQNTWKYIYTDWFPQSGYKHAQGPSLEVYCAESETIEYCEIWIPVIKEA